MGPFIPSTLNPTSWSNRTQDFSGIALQESGSPLWLVYVNSGLFQQALVGEECVTKPLECLRGRLLVTSLASKTDTVCAPIAQKRRGQTYVEVSEAYFYIYSLLRGTWGGPKHRNTAKKINEHRITARKVDETPSPQQLFLATWF